MDKRLLHLISDQVEAVIRNQPPSSPQSLLALLSIAEPNLSLNDVYDKSKRDSAFKALQSLIHPDKFTSAFGNDPKAMSRVTRLFTDMSDFYLMCVDHLKASNVDRSIVVVGGDSIQVVHTTKNKDTTTARGTTYHREREPQPYSHTHYSEEETLAVYQTNRRNKAAASPAQEHFRSSRRDMRSVSPQSNSINKNETTALQKKKRRPRDAPSPHGRQTTTATSLSPPRHAQRTQHDGPSLLEAYSLSGRLPVTMDALQVWPFLRGRNVSDNNDDVSRNHRTTYRKLSWTMACRCLNARGAIVHGQRLREDYFRVANSSKLLDKYQTVGEVLEHFGSLGQAHMFKNKRDIQHEIIQHGPVISISFRPDEYFFRAHPNRFQPQPKNLPSCHPVLIVGWTVTKTGELWKVQSLYDKNDIVHIGFGQWNIDKTIMAPPFVTLEQIPWQSPGPYLDLKLPRVSDTTRDWRESPTLGISLSPHELETLSHILARAGSGGGRGGGGFQSAIANRTPFVIRDKNRLAYSRRYVLREVTTSHGGKWKISVERFDADFEKEGPTISSNALTYQPTTKAIVARKTHDLVEI